MRFLLVGFCVSLLAEAQSGPVIRLFPVDDTARDSAFRSYVGKLRSAVDGRKTDALRKLVDKDVVVGPENEDKGWTKFVERWRPDDRENSPVWKGLSDLLSLGFIQEHPSLFLSPYLVWRFPDNLSMSGHLVAVKDKVEVRERPSPNSRPVATLVFDVVRQLGELQGGEELVQWIPVQTLDGKSGYVNARDVMSPLMPRAQFGKQRGKWILIALEGPEQ
ncbi:MAG: SH3 domain-containing protein [Bryobacteraceae bacterium]|nr:SH3 domain-containing protein [Bryobacteraceae bacterium]